MSPELSRFDRVDESAKRRRRRRYFVAAALGVAVAAAAAITIPAAHSSRTALGICATRPAGWEKTSIPRGYDSTGVASVSLANWHETATTGSYPPDAVTVGAANVEPDWPSPPTAQFSAVFHGALFEAHTAVHRGDRVIGATVGVGAVTARTVAAANRVLAGIRVCPASRQPYIWIRGAHG